MQAVRAGDDHAFERLYGRYEKRIRAYVFGMVHDYGRAEDLTQEVFVSALRRMRQTDREIAFKPWVYEIAKNACIDAFRRSRRAEEVSIDAEDGAGLAPADHGKLCATGPTPEAAVEGKQDLAHLTGAFDGLSDAHHQILVMRELEGLSYREIGERLGMSRPSVESTLFRARRRLTEEYEELRTGERCLRIQEIIGRGAAAAGGRLGVRDQRRLSSHVSHCQPCRRHAVLAGMDATVLARRTVRAKLAAFLPLPAVLKRRWFGGGGDGGASDAATSHAMAKASMVAAQYGEPSMAGWMKATAVAATVAVAGVGAGAAGHGGGSGHRAADGGAGAAKVVQHGAVSGGGATGASGATGGALRTASSGGGGATGASSHRTVRASRTAGGASHGSSTGSAGSGAAGSPVGAGQPKGSGTFSGGGSSGGGGSGSGSGSSSGGSGGGGKDASTASTHDASPSTKPASGGSTSAGATSNPVSDAVNQTAGAVTGAAGAVTGGGGSGGGASQPLVDPNLGALTQPASTPPPTTVGGAVSQTTNTLGQTVGGTAGQVVEDAGQAVGNTVDDVTTTVDGAVSGLLGGSKK